MPHCNYASNKGTCANILDITWTDVCENYTVVGGGDNRVVEIGLALILLISLQKSVGNYFLDIYKIFVLRESDCDPFACLCNLIKMKLKKRHLTSHIKIQLMTFQLTLLDKENKSNIKTGR